MSLRPCLNCTRHVRNIETACPFCGANLPDAPAPLQRSVVGLGRAAIMAFGAIAVATEVGCNATPAAPSLDAGPDATFIGGLDAAYGGPPLDAAMPTDAATSPGNDAGGSVAAYGAPPEDAGNQSDTGGGIGPLYGGAP